MTRPPRPRATIAPPIVLVHKNVLVKFRSTISCHFGQRQLCGGNVDATPADIVDQDVNRAILVQCLVARGLTFVRAADIGGNRKSLPTESADVFGRRFEVLLVARHQDNVGTRVGNGHSHFAAQATSATRNQHPFAIQPKSV